MRKGGAVAVEAGVTVGETFRALFERWGVVIPLGEYPEIGPGGHAVGGAFGFLCGWDDFAEDPPIAQLPVAGRRNCLSLKEDEKRALLDVLQRISDIFWGPDIEKCEGMCQITYWLPFDRLIPRLDPSAAVVLDKIKAAIKNFSDVSVLADELEEGYVRLFVSNRQGIQAPLYASCYETEDHREPFSLMGGPALEMRKRFESKGLSLADNIHEPPDHLAIELEYLYFLLEKGWAEDDDPLLREARQFASEIMLPWVGQLQQRLEAIETENQFYPRITTLLSAILKMIGEI